MNSSVSTIPSFDQDVGPQELKTGSRENERNDGVGTPDSPVNRLNSSNKVKQVSKDSRDPLTD